MSQGQHMDLVYFILYGVNFDTLLYESRGRVVCR